MAYFSAPIDISTVDATAGSASVLGLRATVPVYPSSPWFRLHTFTANVVVCAP